MNVKDIFKKIGLVIGSFFTALAAFVIYGTINRRNDRNTSSGPKQVRDDLTTAAAANRDAEKRTEQLKHSAQSAGQLNKDIGDCTEECLDIIRNAKQNAAKKKD